MSEIARLLRHVFAPAVAYLVTQGYLPEYMQSDVTEGLVVGTAIIIPLAVSKYRDVVK